MTTVLDELLEPLDTPYTDLEAMERMRKLTMLHTAAAENPALADAIAELTRQSFWAHLALMVWTHDEKAAFLRLKPFSALRCYKILADFLDPRDPATGAWRHPVFCGDKSRQLMMSWFWICRLDWCAINTPHADCPIISKTDPDGAKLIERIKTVHQNYAPWYRLRYALHDERSTRHNVGSVVYANASVVQSLPQRGGNAIRMRVPTMVLCDEAAFQEHFEKNWTAIKGTCDNRTQLAAITTAAASHFQKLIEDRLDGRGGRAAIHHSSTGLTLWQNRDNEIDCCRMHYTADPARRTAEWMRQARRGMSNYQWRQEQEIDYAARGGKPIFKMLDAKVHLTDGHLEVVPLGKGWGLRIQGDLDLDGQQTIRPVRLMRAIDHGTTNYCAALWIAVDADLDWFVYRVYKRTGWFAPENAAAIARASWNEAAGRYERYQRDVIDAMQGLPDRRGKIEDIYRNHIDGDGLQPLVSLEAVKKGPGSRQEGLDLIAGMLHSTLAVCAPEHPYWALEGYEPWLRDSFAGFSSLYLARDMAEAFFDELDKARWDEPTHDDPELQSPETALKMKDDLIDCARYLTRAAGPSLLRQVKREMAA